MIKFRFIKFRFIFQCFYFENLSYLINNNHKSNSINSKKILIYTGFHNTKWNYTYALNSALGGSEKAVAFMTKELPKDYEIFISGDVKEEVIDNITYIHRFNLQKLLETTEFHTIIISRYISFFILYPKFKCHKLIVSLHDEQLLNNIVCSKSSPNDLFYKYINIIDNIVILTEWHKNKIYDLLNLVDSNKIKIINNGINIKNNIVDLEYTDKKIKNSFAYTSCTDRGLQILLELWPSILEKMPDATLNISSYLKFPRNNNENKMNDIITNNKNSIKHLGCLNQNELFELMQKTEYWLYVSMLPETSCITALEMLLSEVICMYYPLGGLNNTLGNYGTAVVRGSEINTIEYITNLTTNEKNTIKLKGKEYAISCSWNNRAKEWDDLIKYTPEIGL